MFNIYIGIWKRETHNQHSQKTKQNCLCTMISMAQFSVVLCSIQYTSSMYRLLVAKSRLLLCREIMFIIYHVVQIFYSKQCLIFWPMSCQWTSEEFHDKILFKVDWQILPVPLYLAVIQVFVLFSIQNSEYTPKHCSKAKLI